MNEQRQALLEALDGLGGARLPGGTIAWPAVVLAVLAALVLALLMAVLLRRAHRRRQAMQGRLAWVGEARAALAELDARLAASVRADTPDTSDTTAGDAPIEAPPSESTFQAQRAWVAEAATLARRVALVIEARERIAPLSGSAWLQHLDRMIGQQRFTTEPVAALAQVPYRPAAAVPPATRRAIRDALETLIDVAEQRCRQSAAGGEDRSPASARSSADALAGRPPA